MNRAKLEAVFIALAIIASGASATLALAGHRYTVRLEPGRKRPLEVWDRSRLVDHALLRQYHPWRLEIADVDSHGQAIAVGVDKPTHNLHFPHRTLFLISFDGRSLKRKWTASTMGRPLLDFCFSPSVPQRLVTLERCLDGRVALSAYHWVGFGFRKDGETLWRTAKNLHASPSDLTCTANGHQVSLGWKSILR